ncbi:MAG: cyclic nucleotide-binding domain-containing protein [Alphaproteobacteria bacterium]|nr:cyclic nucleotide-binding domain-containing protein [Alphaproteobacteria bacterium]
MSVAKVVDRKVFFAGQTVFKQGDKGDRAYLVQDGLIEISCMVPGYGEKILGTVGRGSIFGEMALVDNQPRMATAIAQEQTTVVIISADAFNEKLNKADPFIRALLNIFVRNLREAAKKQ